MRTEPAQASVKVKLPGWRLRRAETPEPKAGLQPLARLPRITRLMALAIKLQDMVDRGEVRDYADLARLGYVSRARITQIMNLINLAPCIQEALLFPDASPKKPVCERRIRRVARLVLWRDQISAFSAVPGSGPWTSPDAAIR